MLNQNELKDLYYYCPETGMFARRTSVNYKIKSGCLSAVRGGCGYLNIAINGKQYLSHRAAWVYMHGEIHEGCIDHINGNRSDNRIRNLRVVAKSENNKNMSRNSANKSGVTGVYWCKPRSVWVAQIQVNGKAVYLGGYQDKNDAIASRESARIEHGYHENHGRDNIYA